ncbi:nucleotidyltransferase domain-containing protein [Halosimplex salinum]|uniref:nucleotidyltransferase domain-containing protein n=1 Tax=Halosimplex salinum TaxID=1710538 RepID=UPI000F48D4B3|nr:nucleotidyltransferase family protein [Halosimplex salinum]
MGSSRGPGAGSSEAGGSSPLASLDAEQTAILDCLRRQIDTGSGRLEAASDTALDWDRLEELARRHRVRPIAYHVRSEHHSDGVPRDRLGQWTEQLERNTKRNLQLSAELCALLEAFDERGVRALPYKGPAVAAEAYGDVSAREFGDLDVIISKPDFEAAKRVLRDRGYEIQYESPTTDGLSRAQESLVLQFGRGFEFVSEDRRVSVDLHWRFLPPRSSFPVDFDDVWARRQTVSVAGRDVPKLSTEDTVLLLCVHGTRHGLQLLRGVCDLGALIERSEIDWAQVSRRASRLGCERRVGIGIKVARELLAVDVPDEVVDRLESDPVVADLVEQLYDWLFDAEHDSRDDPRFKYRMHERRRDRLTFLIRWTFYPHQKEIELVSLPESLAVLYYPLRPLRLLGEASTRLLPGT